MFEENSELYQENKHIPELSSYHKADDSGMQHPPNLQHHIQVHNQSNQMRFFTKRV